MTIDGLEKVELRLAPNGTVMVRCEHFPHGAYNGVCDPCGVEFLRRLKALIISADRMVVS